MPSRDEHAILMDEENSMKIVVDMMGGDNGSPATKEAVKRFKEAHKDVELILVGKEEELADMEGYRIIPAKEVIAMEAGAMEVLRKKEASMVKAMYAVKSENADAVVSCGSTGAFLSSATLILKKIPGVIRPALAVAMPHIGASASTTIFLDAGSSNENTPEEMAQFGYMGSLYAKCGANIASPKVALLSNGSEEGKGSPEGKEAYKLLKEDKRIDFIGNIESNYVLTGEANVVVTDGYSGNICIKAIEGTAKTMGKMLKQGFMRNLASKIGYLLAKKGVDNMKKTMDTKRVGGAMLLGVNAVAVKGHGNSDATAFYYSLELAYRLASNSITSKIKEGFSTDEA